MSHAYYHAQNSAKLFGGTAEDYLPIHNWFDSSKRACVDFRHRATRHHLEGVIWCEELFGSKRRNSDGEEVPVRVIAEQHLREDMGGDVPSLADWLDQMTLPEWLQGLHAIDVQAEVIRLSVASARRFGGLPNDYKPVHQWFFDPLRYVGEDKRLHALSMRHHATGIFWAEERFGVAIEVGNGRMAPVRLVGEDHVNALLGMIPTLPDWMFSIQGKTWMNHCYRMESKGGRH